MFMFHLSHRRVRPCVLNFFFLNDSAPTEIYTLSLHDALSISSTGLSSRYRTTRANRSATPPGYRVDRCTPSKDRKSTRLNSSHPSISYAVFCLKKKNCTTGSCKICLFLLGALSPLLSSSVYYN